MAPRRVDARALGANRARGGTEPDARHVSARVSVAAERRCASAMSVRRARVTARGMSSRLVFGAPDDEMAILREDDGVATV
jgi:hypothetical protein